MPALSKSQRRLFGQVHALQKGELKPSDLDPKYRDEIVKLAKQTKYKKDFEKFAKTKHKGLPEKVREGDGYNEVPEEIENKKDAVQSGLPKLREIIRKEIKKFLEHEILYISIDRPKEKRESINRKGKGHSEESKNKISESLKRKYGVKV